MQYVGEQKLDDPLFVRTARTTRELCITDWQRDQVVCNAGVIAEDLDGYQLRHLSYKTQNPRGAVKCVKIKVTVSEDEE
jgi:hypothetical protein